jgi:hypothetical protein
LGYKGHYPDHSFSSYSTFSGSNLLNLTLRSQSLQPLPNRLAQELETQLGLVVHVDNGKADTQERALSVIRQKGETGHGEDSELAGFFLYEIGRVVDGGYVDPQEHSEWHEVFIWSARSSRVQRQYQRH